MVFSTFGVGKASVNWLAVASDTSELVRTVAVGPANFSASTIFADFVAATLSVGLAIYSAESLVTKLSNRTSIVGRAGNIFYASRAGVATETVPAPTDCLVVLRDADGVHATFGVALARINAFVSDADVSAAALFVPCAFNQLTAVLCISCISGTTRANSSVVNSATVGIDTACRWVFTQVSAVWCSIDVNTSRCWRAISISIVANVWIMTSNASLLSVGIANQIARASTDVASRIVLTYGSVMAWVLFAFIRINTVESSIVLVAQLAFTESLAVLNSTGTMRSTLYPVTWAFTNKMNTFLVDWAVRVMKAVHLNTTSVLVIRIAGVQGTSRTSTLSLVIHHSAGCVWSTGLFFTRIDALGHSILVTGSIQRAI